MRKSIPASVSLCLGALFSLAHCSNADPDPNSTASDGTPTGGTSTDAAGATTTSNGNGNGATNGQTTSTNGTASNVTGSTSTTGSSTSTTGGGPTGTTGSGGASTTTTTDGGVTTDASTTTTTGTGGTGGMPNVIDPNTPNAKAGDVKTGNQEYLKLGEIRILNNNWGSEDLGCTQSAFSVFVEQDKTFGWTFDRGGCGDTQGSKPDFPQIEFGVHPFGTVPGMGRNDLATSPNFSSTTLMPIQIQDITSASVTIDSLNVQLESPNVWNITFEFWVSERHPVDDPNPGMYAELMTFWGWQNGRWPSAPGADGSQDGGSGAGDQVQAGKSYTLWVQRDQWADGWRYYQFRADDGPQQTFNGKLDVMPFIDYLKNNRGFPQDYWITRLEVGSEIGDNTKGRVSLRGITFEVNGETRDAIIED